MSIAPPSPIKPSLPSGNTLSQVIITAIVVVVLLAGYHWVASNLHVSISWGTPKPPAPGPAPGPAPKPTPRPFPSTGLIRRLPCYA